MTKIATLEKELAKNPRLKQEDIDTLREWMEKQPHLPIVTDLFRSLVLHSTYFNIEAAKVTMDKFCTSVTQCPEFFTDRNANVNDKLKAMFDVILFQPLARLLPNGFSVFITKLMDPNPSHYAFDLAIKTCVMTSELYLYEEGTTGGHVIVIDVTGGALGHLMRVDVGLLRKFLYYLQEASPVRLKQIHFINLVPIVDKLISMMKPFLKNEMMNHIHLHSKIETLYEFVPKEYLPEDYGGSGPSLKELHEDMKRNLLNAGDQFEQRDGCYNVDESKRVEKMKNAGECFGMDGSFKKLDID